jgi:hypothetical protein
MGGRSGTAAIGLTFGANVCGSLNTPTNWIKLGCQTFGSTSAAAVFYQGGNAGNSTPTFTWTGSTTVNGGEIVVAGTLMTSQLDLASAPNTGAATTSMTATGVTTTAVLDHIIAWYFTDNSASGVTFTPPADMGLTVSLNQTAFNAFNVNEQFVTEKRQKVAGATGNETGTASSSSDYAAFLMAFKTLTPPVARTIGDVVPAIIYNGCKGSVTLSGGAGTFTNTCVKTASFCQCRDTTTPANACTTANPASGSVGITGTGSDADLINCI